ncbi:MAG: O-methyltransferase [Chloroflexota bacterium]
MEDRPAADPGLLAYAESHSSPQPEYLAQVAAHTREFSVASGQMVGPVVGRLLAMLVHLTGARRVLEIGTYTGYSALCVAEALPAGGSVVTCEVDPEHARMAQEHIARSPYKDQIEIRLGRALKTVTNLEGPFDFAYIDAELTGYRAYLDAVLPKLAPGGFIVANNVLWKGRVVIDDRSDADTRAMAEFNETVAADPRLDCVMLTVGEGLTIIRPRTT